MTSKTPMFPGWNALAGRAAKSLRTRAEEERRRLSAEGLAGMSALLEGWVNPELFAPSSAGPGPQEDTDHKKTDLLAIIPMFPKPGQPDYVPYDK